MKGFSLLLSKHVLIVLAFIFPLSSGAHSEGQDSNGGHVDRSTGEYHCHKLDCILPVIPDPTSGHIYYVVSFNIQFLGDFKKRDNEALAALIAPYDVVVVQELIAPPFNGNFPDGSSYKPDTEAQQFFNTMKAKGLDFTLSEEGTGTKDKIHLNSAATQWWVVFYKPSVVESADDLPHGYLASDRTNHDDYERVPYAFS